MADRLASHMLVGALVRRAEQEGGFAIIIHRGDDGSGVILVQCLEKGRETGLFERIPDFDGGYRLIACGPDAGADGVEKAAYVERRIRADPDLWIVELDILEAERFAAETIC
jgi:hypothetical protein